MFRVALSAASITFLFIAAAAPTARGGDLDELQGSWEMYIVSGGVRHRVVKKISGQTETVQVFKGDEVVQKHQVKFELKQYGPAKVFIWRNGQISVGPRAGQRLADGRFIYRLEGDTWTAVHGMLDGDRTDVLREVYKRIEDLDPPPAT